MASANFPPGMRFVPTDEEIIVDYLLNKIRSLPIPINGIADVNLYHYNPHTLTQEYPPLGEREWYFFTPLVRKHPNGTRPNRAAGSGYWKSTGSDRPILFQNQLVGFKRSLVFYEGHDQKNGKKTNWIMHEYKADLPPRTKTTASDMRLEDWVLCRIYKRECKARGDRKGKKGNEEVVDQNQVNEEVGDTADYGNDQEGIVGNTTPLVDEKVLEHCSFRELLYDGLNRDPLPPIWLREMSPKFNFDDDDDAFLAIDEWPEFFTDGNNATCSCASSQVSSIVPATASDANFVVDSNLVKEEDADYQLIV